MLQRFLREIWQQNTSLWWGQLQWLVTLGRFDLHAHVAPMSRFRAAPRQGHMDRLKGSMLMQFRTKGYVVGFGAYALNSLLQYVNSLIWEVCSVN